MQALSQILCKLADKALTALSGTIGSILSWISNRAKEVIGWLSQNLWALITGIGVLIYTYFMMKTRSFEQPPDCKDGCYSQYQSCLFFLMSIRFGFHHFFFFELMLGSVSTILISCLCSLLDSMSDLIFIVFSLLDLASGLSFSSSRFFFILVQC